MAKRKKRGLLGKLYFYTKLIVWLCIVAAIVAGVLYFRQSEPQRKQIQESLEHGVVSAGDWLISRSETNERVDKWLRSLIEQILVRDANGINIGVIDDDERFTLYGLPLSQRPLSNLTHLENEAYAVGYDEEMENPSWVAYRLGYNPQGQTAKRPSGFNADTRTGAKVTHDDYTYSGYDRGHMAPNYAIGVVYGANAQRETFLMSNIVPQRPSLNRGPWKDLEQLIAKEYLRDCEELWVITGPIYRGNLERLESGVAIPSHFFKIIIDVLEGQNLRAIAFIMPQVIQSDDLSKYLSSVDDIEDATQLDFFSELDDEYEDRIEGVTADLLW